MNISTELKKIAQGIIDAYYANRQDERQVRLMICRLRQLADSISDPDAPAKAAEPAPKVTNKGLNADSAALAGIPVKCSKCDLRNECDYQNRYGLEHPGNNIKLQGVVSIKPLRRPRRQSEEQNNTAVALLCDIKGLLLNFDNPTRDARKEIIDAINAVLALPLPLANQGINFDQGALPTCLCTKPECRHRKYNDKRVLVCSYGRTD